MCFSSAWTDSEVLAEALRRVGVEVRRDGEVYAVYGKDRDVLEALRTRDLPVAGISPPGIDARLAVADLRGLRDLASIRCSAYDVPRLTARSGGGEVVAVNEVALLAREPAVFVRYSLYVDGQLAFNDMGDGVLVATPLGSTAYALSAGGPQIRLDVRALEVVPVNSALSRRPLVLPLEASIELRRARSVSELLLIADGAARLRYSDPAQISVRGFARLLLPLRAGGQPDVRLPPSALLIRNVLASRGPQTAAELAEATGLPLRTVRHALERLRRAGLARAYPDPTDPRRRIYTT